MEGMGQTSFIAATGATMKASFNPLIIQKIAQIYKNSTRVSNRPNDSNKQAAFGEDEYTGLTKARAAQALQPGTAAKFHNILYNTATMIHNPEDASMTVRRHRQMATRVLIISIEKRNDV
ncbi:hypothetical protein ACJX0J_031671, partial [Zea mays]